MIPAAAVTGIIAINVLIAGVLGIVAGGVACAILRRPWGIRAAFVDAAVSVVVSLAAAFVLSTMHVSFDFDAVYVTFFIGAGSAVFRRVIVHARPRGGAARSGD